jgi:hypothetical protein
VKRKCYISGPISGLPAEEYLLNFYRASRYVETLGYEAVNPCDLNHAGHDQTWESYMRVDIIALMGCEAICLLANWGTSVGARTEYHLAQVLGMDVLVHADGPEMLIEAAMDADIMPEDIAFAVMTGRMTPINNQ